MNGIPFEAALFDLDGTLLDSLPMWRALDGQLFARRGLPVPEAYGREIAGKSHRECAQYTVEKYLPGESPEALLQEWYETAQREYALHICMKPGARPYLRMLKRRGVKLAVVTALPLELFAPCLERLGIAELFDEMCSLEQTEGQDKETGEIYRMAADRLGVSPEACAVFEDVLPGVKGAKTQGMRVYCMLEKDGADNGALEALADACITSFEDMRREHPWYEEGRCVIFTARCDGDLRDTYVPDPEDYVLCADGGWKLAVQLGVMPDVILGDFDSSEAPHFGDVERYPVRKDDTDTMLCLKRGLRQGYERFVIVGGFGGRVDHSFANVQTMAYAAEHGAQAEMCDGITRAIVLRDSAVTLNASPGGFAVFSLSDTATGVSIRGAQYDVEDAVLTNAFPLGAGNHYRESTAEISVAQGTLLVLQMLRDE